MNAVISAHPLLRRPADRLLPALTGAACLTILAMLAWHAVTGSWNNPQAPVDEARGSVEADTPSGEGQVGSAPPTA